MLNEHDLDRAFPTPDADATAALRARLAVDADAAGLLDVACRTVDSPFGPLLIAVTDAGVARVAFEREDHERVLAHLATDISPRILRAAHRTEAVARQLDEYFDGRRRNFDLAVDLQLAHGFRHEVLVHLPRHRLRPHRELRRSGARGRTTRRGAGGGERVLAQPGPGRRALSPCRPQ